MCVTAVLRCVCVWPTGSCTLKDPQQLKGFSLEAAVFCKKTQCEEKMNIHVKQRRVMYVVMETLHSL